MSRQTTLTILFADVCRSTQLFEQYGDVKARELISNTLNELTVIVERYQGVVIKTIGDEIMCTFPTAENGILASCEMQRRVNGDINMLRHGIAIRVGLHHGNVIEEDNDVFGDAVNVSARMAGLAKAHQIVTTASSADGMPLSDNMQIRALGKTRVKGKLLPIDTVDILWQEDTSNVTTVSQALNLEELTSSIQIQIRFQGKVIDLKETSPPFMIGRDLSNDLTLDDEWVSRNHASIECRKGVFVLIDRSTNGTYLKTAGDQEFRLHRDEAHLRREGVISLGQFSHKRSVDTLIEYNCVE